MNKITLTKKNWSQFICSKNDFFSEQVYENYSKMVDKFKNNNKYYFEFECFKCDLITTTYHWVVKCIKCGFRHDILNTFIKKQELFLSGYWEPKNVFKRFKNKSIYNDLNIYK